MPVRRAIANGNWSSTSTWFGGVLPGNGDTVAAGGFNIVCDVDILIGGANNPDVTAGSFVSGQWYRITSVGTTLFTSIGASANAVGITFQATGVGSGTGVATALATITTAAIAAASAAAGGGFSLSTNRSMNVDMRAATTPCLTVSSTANLSLTDLQIVGGTTAGTAHAIAWSSTGTLTLQNCSILGGVQSPAINNSSAGIISASSCVITAGNSTTPCHAISNNGNGSVSISGSTISAGNANQSASAVLNNSGGSITIVSSTINGGFGAGLNSYGVFNNVSATGAISCSGCTLVGVSGPALFSASISSITCTNCTFTAGSSGTTGNAVSINVPAATVILSGSMFDGATGLVAVSCPRYRLGTIPSLMQHRFAVDGTSTFLTLYTADFGVFGNPVATDVRSGVSYGDGSLTGTCAVPPAGSVALGVPVDNTTGSAVLTAAAVQSAVLPLL